MEDYNWMYKIAYQLFMNKIHAEIRYEEALEDLGEDDKITKYYKQQLADAEEAVKLFDEQRERLEDEACDK